MRVLDSSRQISVRCRSCRRYIAGPLEPKPLDGVSELEPLQYTTFARLDFEIPPYCELSPKSEDDLVLNDVWAWKEYGGQDWLCPQEQFGIYCCGGPGVLKCHCGNVLGRFWSECIPGQWVILYDESIDRSDRSDGTWMLLGDVVGSETWLGNAGQIHDAGLGKWRLSRICFDESWVERVGQLVNGKPEGEWNCWLHRFSYLEREQRSKARQQTVKQEQRVDRLLVCVEKWSAGHLIESVDL